MIRVLVILVLILTLPICGDAQRKRAFLVGISNYKSNGYKVWHNIHGAEDIRLLTPELIKKGFAVDTLTNERATFQGILTNLVEFVKSTKKGDIVYLHFSSHGQPVEDGMLGDVKDEKDGWDESLVPIDAGKEYNPDGYRGEKHITDDTLNVFFSRLCQKIGSKGMLYVAMDACHAGSMSRKGVETIRGTNEGLTMKSAKYNPPKDNIKHYILPNQTTWAPVLFLEACRSRERNTEIWVNRKKYGALSYHISQALNAMPSFNKNAQEFKDYLDASTKQMGCWPRTQTLVVESSF